MKNVGAIENFPIQLLSYEDLQSIIDDVLATLKRWQSDTAKSEWEQLAGWVKEALSSAFLYGPRAKDKWLPRMTNEIASIEQRCLPEEAREIRIAYLTTLDRIYGSVIRHVFRRVPTALLGSQGSFCLDKVKMFRYTRVRDTTKPALEQIMEFIYQGGPRFEMEFEWHSLRE